MNTSARKTCCVSVVSHGHANYLSQLIPQLLQCDSVSEIIITHNIPETVSLAEDDRIRYIRNATARGFADNHNHAFKLATSHYFCVLNPDCLIQDDPFQFCQNILRKRPDIGVVAPQIINPMQQLEDSAREFPSLRRMMQRLICRSPNTFNPDTSIQTVDWLAGMFLFFKSSVFKQIGGFDADFFLYCEDVDICVNAWQHGYKVVRLNQMRVVHDAQRRSRRSFKYLRFHLASLVRLYQKHGLGFSRARSAKAKHDYEP